MKDHICPALEPAAGLRCWRRDDHAEDHFTVWPNHDSSITQRPVISTWANHGGMQ